MTREEYKAIQRWLKEEHPGLLSAIITFADYEPTEESPATERELFAEVLRELLRAINPPDSRRPTDPTHGGKIYP